MDYNAFVSNRNVSFGHLNEIQYEFFWEKYPDTGHQTGWSPKSKVY